MQIGTIAAGVGTSTTINLTWLPQFIFWTNATVLQSLKVTVYGDGVIADQDSNGINSLSNIRALGRFTDGYTFPLADGLIPAKNVEIVATNGVAAAISLYAISMQKGSYYMQSLRQTVLANSGATLTKFAFLGMIGAGATDVINIDYVDGLSQKVDPAELAPTMAQFNNVVTKSIDNMDGRIKAVYYTPAANVTVNMLRFTKVGNLSQNALM
jgi:hypothetical protein